MTPDQHKDLLVEWSLYGPSQQNDIIEEFFDQLHNENTAEAFLDYLRDKLEIDGYWKKIGLI